MPTLLPRVRDRLRPHFIELAVVSILGTALIVSFVHGWYWDTSTPRGGVGWFDQNLYTKAAQQLGSFDLPSRDTFHYQMGYPLLGAVGYQVMPSDPFMLVSVGLLLGSAVFGYLATRSIVGWQLASLFVISLFVWDLVGRSFNFASELFVVPWNNQVTFFAVCFFFWVIAARVARGVTLSHRLALTMGVVAGVTIMTREEFALFVVPLLAFILWRLEASRFQWALCGGVMVVAYLPQFILKVIVVGDATASLRDSRGYLDLLGDYIDPRRLARNAVDVVFDSSVRGIETNRKSVLDAAPWLWLAPVGIVAFMARRAEATAVKWFIVWSGVVFLFFLGGENVAHHKLRFHCIRYLTPGFPALHFGVVYAGSMAWERIAGSLGRGTDRGGGVEAGEGAGEESVEDSASS